MPAIDLAVQVRVPLVIGEPGDQSRDAGLDRLIAMPDIIDAPMVGIVDVEA